MHSHEEEWLTLSEVYWAQLSGAVRKLKAPLHAVAQLRLLYDVGILTPVDVALPALPDDTEDFVREAYEGFRLLCGLRWLAYPQREGVTYTPRFVATWCNLSVTLAERAIEVLEGSGTIDAVGETKSAFGSTIPTYLPGGMRTVSAPSRRATQRPENERRGARAGTAVAERRDAKYISQQSHDLIESLKGRTGR